MSPIEHKSTIEIAIDNELVHFLEDPRIVRVFSDVVVGALTPLVGDDGGYSLIICSFAFHLCDATTFASCCKALGKIGNKLLKDRECICSINGADGIIIF